MTDVVAPRSVKEFEERLIEVADTLPKRLRQCADFVAANHDRIAVSTVAEMSESAGVQPSAFMRFCQIMGFSGYSEMQKLFRETLVGGWPDYNTRLDNLRQKGGSSATTLLAEFVDTGRASLENLLKNIDQNELDRASELLAEAHTIHIIGMRRSFSVASYLAYAFENMNIPSILHNSAGQLLNRSVVNPGDVAIAIAFAPYSTETVEFAKFAHNNDVPVIALTDTAVSPLRKYSNHMICISEVDYGSFRSLSATMCIAIALAVAVGTIRED